MALGTHREAKQHDLWVPREALYSAAAHVFYDKLNKLLDTIGFDDAVELLCSPHYALTGRPGIAPGLYFRMLLIGYFENIDSQRGIGSQNKSGSTFLFR